MKAKDTSHLGMIIGAVCLFIIFIITVIKFFKENITITTDNAMALILLGISPSIPFSPIYVSKWLDKLIELKKSNKNHF